MAGLMEGQFTEDPLRAEAAKVIPYPRIRVPSLMDKDHPGQPKAKATI